MHNISDAEDDLPGTSGTELADFPGAAGTKIQEHKGRIRALRSVYNSAAPINRTLPVELLMEIFSRVHPVDFSRRRGMFMLRICRFWTDVLYRTPQFWSNVLAKHHVLTSLSDRKLERFRVALKYSGTRPLSLSFRALPIPLAELLCLHADRITALHVDINIGVEGLDMLLEAKVPVLERLSITPWTSPWVIYWRSGRHSSEYARLPNITALPALRSIRVASGHFTDSIASSTLCHVDLIGCWCPACKAGRPDDQFRHLLRTLAQCTSLETLRLKRCIPSSPMARERRLPGSTILPRLRHLEVHDFGSGVSTLLAHLIFPTSTSLELKVGDGFILPEPFDIRTLHAVASADHVSFDFRQYSWSHSRPPCYIMDAYVQGRRLLKMSSADYSRSNTADKFAFYSLYIEDIANIFGSTSRVTSLDVRGIKHRRPGEDTPYPTENVLNRWTALLRSFPCLTQLAIGSESDDFALILEALSQPQSEGATACLCPSLRALSGVWNFVSSWPWVDKNGLEKTHGENMSQAGDEGTNGRSIGRCPSNGLAISSTEARDWRWRSNRILTMREIAGSHVETEDPVTWLPYGIAETRAFAARIAPFLSRRAASGAAPLKELRIGVREVRVYHSDDVRDQEYLRRHLPAEPLESRLATLLDGLVEHVAVTKIGPFADRILRYVIRYL